MSLRLEFFGLDLELLPARLVYVKSEQTLLVADLHLGKDATFRARGVAVPVGPSDRTLERLSSAVQETGARRVVLLGDLFHGRESNLESERQGISAFLVKHSAVELHLVLGNHDRWVEQANLPGQIHREFQIGEVSMKHDPSECSGPSIAGHLHPGFRVPMGARSSQMLPCFWQHGSCLVLPAFGEFTGLYGVQPEPGDRAFVVAGRSVCEMPV